MDARAAGGQGASLTAPITICLHGPESTGKSTIAPRLAAHFGAHWVPEYGRTWSEANGTDFDMAALLEIARAQDAMAAEARALGGSHLVLDTDPLMTAVWADMLFGHRDRWFDAWSATADFYLLFDIDLPWIADGTRMFGEAGSRRRFLDLSRRELERRGMRWAWVRGAGEARFGNALAAIEGAGLA